MKHRKKLKNTRTDEYSMKKKNKYAVIGKNILFKIANKVILDDLNINVEKQSIYALLGENEAGKSVLLKCIMGILKLDDGDITIANNVSGGTSSDSISRVSINNTMTIARRSSIGFAPQNFNVPGPVRIYQLLNYISSINGLSKHQILDRYKAIATMIGIPISDHLVNRLKYNQRKVLSLVLAVIHEPELIILDDITSGMDSITLKNIWTLLTNISKSRKCTIIVSACNNFCFMETAVTHIGILIEGKILEDTTINILKKYETSNITDLLIKIIPNEDEQTTSSARTTKLPKIESHTTYKDTTLLNSILIAKIDVSEKRENILQTLILKNIWTLVETNVMLYALLVYIVVLPFIVHLLFEAYPQHTVLIVMPNQKALVTNTSNELSDHEVYQGIESTGYVFAKQYLAKSFQLIYTSTENITEFDYYSCILSFNKNYTAALQRRMEREIKNDIDFENSQIILTINTTIDGRKGTHVKEKLLECYNEFLSDYSHNMLTDINYESVKYNYTMAYDDHDYPIYRRFVYCGLIIILAFFFHAAFAVQLLQVTGDDYHSDKWMLHLSRLVIQIPVVIACSGFTIAQIHMLYETRTHYGYMFLCLLLESVCGIHLGHILSLFVKKHSNITIILYLKLTICIYTSGLWWPKSELLGWIYKATDYSPISLGIFFMRNLIEKQYFVMKSLLILSCWTIILIIITILDIATNNNGKGSIN